MSLYRKCFQFPYKSLASGASLTDILIQRLQVNRFQVTIQHIYFILVYFEQLYQVKVTYMVISFQPNLLISQKWIKSRGFYYL